MVDVMSIRDRAVRLLPYRAMLQPTRHAPIVAGRAAGTIHLARDGFQNAGAAHLRIMPTAQPFAKERAPAAIERAVSTTVEVSVVILTDAMRFLRTGATLD